MRPLPEHLPLLGQFFAFARERERIRLLKEAGEPWPWSGNPVLQQYRFCNIFRRDDRTSRFIQTLITPAGYGDAFLGAILIARWFNRIETIEKLRERPARMPYFKDNLLYSWSLNIHDWSQAIRDRLKDVHPLTTGAYIIKTPNGMNKLDGLRWCLHEVLPKAQELQRDFTERNISIEDATKRLAEFPFLGGFMSYEVVSDLVECGLMAEAPDRLTWANPGPGATRGVSWLIHGHNTGRPSRDTCLKAIRWLVQEANDTRANQWPTAWPAWTAREAEHTLCEFDKFKRAMVNDQRLKRRYTPPENQRKTTHAKVE